MMNEKQIELLESVKINLEVLGKLIPMLKNHPILNLVKMQLDLITEEQDAKQEVME